MIADCNKILLDCQVDDSLHKVLSGINFNVVSQREKMQQIEKAIQMLIKHYPHLRERQKDAKSARTYNVNVKEDAAYLVLTQTLAYLKGVFPTYEGKISKWGIQPFEVWRMISSTWIKDQANNLPDGSRANGMLVGTDISSPQTVPSKVLRNLYKYFDAANQEIREEFAKRSATIRQLGIEFISKKESTLRRVAVGLNYNIWEDLLVKDADGKIAKTLTVKNPYTDTSLDPDQVKYLKGILWEINKFRLNLPAELKNLTYLENAKDIEAALVTNNKLINAIDKGTYFELPLRKASDFDRIRKIPRSGIGTQFKKILQNMTDELDPRQLHASYSKSLSAKESNILEMFNAYENTTMDDRMRRIEQEGADDFEIDLDLLANDVAFQFTRQQLYAEPLLIAESVATMMHFMQQTTDYSYQEILDALDDQLKVFKGESLIKEELQGVTKAVGLAKKLNSTLVLACRPVQFVKEITFGMFTNYSRAWAMKFGSNALDIKTVFNANMVVWGQAFGKYGDQFKGSKDIADYVMCDALNTVYGFANADLNRAAENASLGRKGIIRNASRWMYISNSAPDYVNRLTLFIAKMMKDGCWEAHTLNADGTLHYDFTKDKRFSELKLDEHGNIKKGSGKKYYEQLALYRAMAKEFEESENQTLITFDENGNEILKPLTKAYTTKQRDSIKEVSDLAYGFYDHESKSLMDHKFVGWVWKQFMTFWSAKVQLWLRGKPIEQGDNTSQGKYVQATEDGEKLWRRIEWDASGKPYVIEVKDSELRPEEIDNLEPVLYWQGDYIEGIVYSITGLLNDLVHLDFEKIKNDKYRLANAMLGFHDILIGILLYRLLLTIFSGGSDKLAQCTTGQRIMLRAMADVGPQSIFSIGWEPGFYATLIKLKNDSGKLLTGDTEIQQSLTNNLGAIKDWVVEEQD